MNKHLLQKISGLLAVVLFAISCGEAVGPGSTPASKGISITPPSPIYMGISMTNILTVNFTGFTEEEKASLTLSNGSPRYIRLSDYTNADNTDKDKTNFQVIAIALGGETDSIITARVGEFTATAVVRVVVGLIKITLTPTNFTLAAGNTTTIVPEIHPFDADYTNLTWTSGNPAVATVDTSGRVTGISEGTTTITASNLSGVFATATVKVTDIPRVTKLTVTKLTSTATPSDVRDRYAVFNIQAPSAMNNYRLAIAPAATTLTAADMTAANNLGVHTYDLTTAGINVLMGLVYNAPLLRYYDDIITQRKNTLVDDGSAMAAFTNDTGATGSYNVTGTDVGKAGDIAASMLKPGTSYTLYGLPTGGTVTALLTFSTDPLNNDIPNRRGPVTTNSEGQYPMLVVDNFIDAPLTISTNNYNLYPVRFYMIGSQLPSELRADVSLILRNQGFIDTHPDAIIMYTGYLTEYTEETGPTATPASVHWFNHSVYVMGRGSFSVINSAQGNLSNSPQQIRYRQQ